jgi:betaine-homocysteine S-methyltransferase
MRNERCVLCRYFEHVEEMQWAIEVAKEVGLPVAASMCIGPEGDMHGNSAGECAVLMAKAGANIVGINCHFDPFVSLECMAAMKAGLVDAGFDPDKGSPYLMVQPLGYMTPDAKKQGFIDLPEFPFALEPRTCTRAEMRTFARAAHELGIRFIGLCCGGEAYHLRAIAEELSIA